MMEDEKLIVDKIIESIKEEDRNNNMSEEILTNWKNCMNSLRCSKQSVINIIFTLYLLCRSLINDDNNLEKIAKEYNTDVSTFQECLDEGEMKIEELKTGLENLWGGKKDFNEEQKRQFLFKFKKFDACILKKKQLVIICNNYYTNKLLDIKNSDKKYSVQLKQLSNNYFSSHVLLRYVINA
ncbi:hypothetical protein ALC56_13821 [Trachymyrmex septentrionalis]|uniref:Uncharacterized protein n=1 Tax=Trachymyrmex septentrionalis TaxID=34720 RepID=A0A195EUW4_9HYME|nr:hypothetical protein ALC56_13821 [Trachymyrmex septentrionalis]